MLLIELPGDVLLNIIKFLSAPDIFSVRKTCKRFFAITMDRHVWTTSYKFCENDFMPVVDLASQTVGDLERVLLRSYRLNTLWVTSYANPVCKKIWSIDLSARGIHPVEIEGVEIYQVRYLVLHSAKVVLVFDLKTKEEIFRYDAPKDQYFKFLDSATSASRISNDYADFYLPFSSWTSNSTSSLLVRKHACYFKAWYNRTHTRRRFVLGNSPFYSLCVHASVSDPLRLVTSHIALNDRLELTGHIWLIMNQPDGPRLVQIKLQTDGSLTFVVGSPRLKFLADMQFTVHPCGKTQGITMEQSADLLKKPHLELHHVSADSEQLQVRIGARLGVNDAGRHESDVFQGFLVTVGKKIDIVDLVP
ncbi:hypothetical protein BDP27DRAFT_1357831 [Rhodocollybia butyracea]|uniref:F-box domain-containing protein n=1 Tax=Rhodocollybia butyracea TaxID=206335 RepID=A0A9P5Q9R7_9AGAR|nr:hypothetical protein BDP27DRAFT_1357831 [Rhodocollybia butyracea]